MAAPLSPEDLVVLHDAGLCGSDCDLCAADDEDSNPCSFCGHVTHADDEHCNGCGKLTDYGEFVAARDAAAVQAEVVG